MIDVERRTFRSFYLVYGSDAPNEVLRMTRGFGTEIAGDSVDVMPGNKQTCGALARCRAIHPRTDGDENHRNPPANPTPRISPRPTGGWRPSDFEATASDKIRLSCGGRTHHSCALYAAKGWSSEFPRRRSHIRFTPAAKSPPPAPGRDEP